MMNHQRLNQSITLPLLSALLLVSATAQEKQTKLRFLGFPQTENPEPVELLIGENKTIEVNTPGNELSQSYTVPPLSSIVVGKTVRNEKNDNVFQIYGSTKALAADEQIILLLRKGEKNSDGFEVIPVDGGQANFTGASYLFINTSKLSVGGFIGDKKFALKAGKSKIVKPKPNHKDGICQVTLSYLRGEKWKTFYDTRWPANDKFRSIVFFYQHPKTGRLGIAPIVDVLPYKGE
jgi:hypothetical protein